MLVFDAGFVGEVDNGGEMASMVLTCASISCVLLRKPTRAGVRVEVGCDFARSAERKLA